MKYIKYILLMLICFCMVITLLGCTLLVNKFKVETKDLNGEDDYSLAVLNDNDICAENNACYCVLMGFSSSGSKSYSDEDYDYTHDADFIKFSANSPLSGVAILQLTYGTEDTITFDVECERTEGNVRIVLLDENLNIVYDFDVAQRSSYTVNDAKGKEFEIRVAGESAKFTVNVARQFSSN